ncbi:MAG: hypothetical protein SVM79_01780 [Chloroflexota bacterium]|nr:hypothetical protein [Chloroflexota bacterium]
MRCPICAREVNDEAELMACITNHMQQEVAKQAKEVQRVYLMMMASQLTMACVSTHSTPRDVVGTFGEVYGLIENLVGKNDVNAEIEEWLKKRNPPTEE